MLRQWSFNTAISAASRSTLTLPSHLTHTPLIMQFIFQHQHWKPAEERSLTRAAATTDTTTTIVTAAVADEERIPPLLLLTITQSGIIQGKNWPLHIVQCQAQLSGVQDWWAILACFKETPSSHPAPYTPRHVHLSPRPPACWSPPLIVALHKESIKHK